MNSRRFLLPENRGHVIFVDHVLQHIYQHAQTRFWSREAGGELFSRNPHESSVVISDASGPHSQDTRSRHNFVPDFASAVRDREKQFNLGNHAVGLWHTHPEAIPLPSIQDYETTRKYLEAFEGAMNGFLLLILGNTGRPLNISVWVATVKPVNAWFKLKEI